MSFEDNLKIILNKVKKTIWFPCKLQNILERFTLLIIYKRFIRSHLDYRDIIYDKGYNTSFHQKLELLQFNACLAITRTITGTLKENINEEEGLGSFNRKLGCLGQETILFLQSL